MLKCGLCSKEGLDLSKHIKVHGLTSEKYKQLYGPLVDSSGELKRRQTCLSLHGDANYKNREAIKLSNEIFEGGHSLSDPSVREKANITKIHRYGDANFTNREKAKATCLERYGVETALGLPSVVKKRVSTLISRYGRIFNHTPEPLVTREVLIEKHHGQGLSLREIAKEYGITPQGIAYWMKKYKIEVRKNVVIPRTKKYVPVASTVEEYFNLCMQTQRVLSFSEFGVLTEDKKKSRLKRLFNAGRPYHHLLNELRDIALKPGRWTELLTKIDQ